MTREKSNLAASVRQRLLNHARATGRPFNELLQYFAMERLLYRLQSSSYVRRFVLKGALMLMTWQVSHSRPTKDIDLLGTTPNDLEGVAAVFRDVCMQDVEADGMVFDAVSVQAERIAEESNYEGVRVRFRGTLGTARVTMQVDVGFGDVVVPEPVWIDYPTLLDLPAPRMRGYTRESVVAEKLHAMVQRGLLNSRLRDYFDIWALSRQFDFEGEGLASAIRETFSRRGRQMPAHLVALSDEFAADGAKSRQWTGFLQRSRLSSAPGRLLDVVRHLRGFLGPVAAAVGDGASFAVRWEAPGPWGAQGPDSTSGLP